MPKPPRTAQELLARYASGEREFEGAILENVSLESARLPGVVFRRAAFSAVNLRGANLRGADFGGQLLSDLYAYDSGIPGSVLQDANLDEATVGQANFVNAALVGVTLEHAVLTGTNFALAGFRDTKLRFADLEGVNLEGARFFTGNDFGSVRLAFTILNDIDVSPFIDAVPPVVHAAPSSVDFRSVLHSVHHPRLRDFLLRTGMPEVFVTFMIECAKSVEHHVTDLLRSTFISYGGPDEPFARRLYEALHRNGVTTFFFPETAVPGDKLHRMMRRGVNEHDRVILVCSKASLDRGGVLNEIEETLAREAREGGEALLIPVTIDDYVFKDWAPKERGHRAVGAGPRGGGLPGRGEVRRRGGEAPGGVAQEGAALRNVTSASTGVTVAALHAPDRERVAGALRRRARETSMDRNSDGRSVSSPIVLSKCSSRSPLSVAPSFPPANTPAALSMNSRFQV